MVNCVQQITRTFSYSTSGSLFIKTEPFHFQLFPALHNYYCLLYLSIWLFYGPHISEFTQCLSFCVLIISLSTIPLRITYAVACAGISLLFKGWVIFYVGHFVCHLPVDICIASASLLGYYYCEAHWKNHWCANTVWDPYDQVPRSRPTMFDFHRVISWFVYCIGGKKILSSKKKC